MPDTSGSGHRALTYPLSLSNSVRSMANHWFLYMDDSQSGVRDGQTMDKTDRRDRIDQGEQDGHEVSSEFPQHAE